MAPFYGWGSIASRLEPLGIGSLLSQFAKMFMFTTIFKGEMKIFAYLFQSGCFPPESWQGYLPSLGGIHERFHGQVLIAPKLETHVFQLRRWYELESYLVWLRTLLKLIGEYLRSRVFAVKNSFTAHALKFFLWVVWVKLQAVLYNE